MLFRLFAYIIAGAFLGGAGWSILLVYYTAADFSLVIIPALSILGVISAVFLLMRAGKAIPRGIRINLPLAVASMDSVCIIASTIASLFIIDGNSMWFVASLPLVMNDPLALDVVAFMYLPSALVLAWFVTSSGSQIIAIDALQLAVIQAHINTAVC